jgi:cbb3-type cytochrome oxidase subunit 3
VTPELAYLVFGVTLCVCLAGIGLFYYSRRRKDRVEVAKYKMLEDEES